MSRHQDGVAATQPPRRRGHEIMAASS